MDKYASTTCQNHLHKNHPVDLFHASQYLVIGEIPIKIILLRMVTQPDRGFVVSLQVLNIIETNRWLGLTYFRKCNTEISRDRTKYPTTKNLGKVPHK